MANTPGNLTWLEQNNKLRKIKNFIFSWPNSAASTKIWEKIIINRLWIGHTRLTHGYLMANNENPIDTAVPNYGLTYAYRMLEILPVHRWTRQTQHSQHPWQTKRRQRLPNFNFFKKIWIVQFNLKYYNYKNVH